MEEASDAVLVDDVDEEDWDLDGAITVADADESGSQEKFRQSQTECRVVHTKVPAGVVYDLQKTKRSTTFEEQLR